MCEKKQESLFDAADQSARITVLKSRFLNEELTDYKSLFEGFQHLRAITFSYGLGFLSDVVSLFDDAEVILGSQKTVRPDIVDVAFHQSYEMRRISKHKKLVSRVNDGTLSFWFNMAKMSHEKLYIMWSDEGRSRVLVGSANFSKRAFTGGQHEEIVCFDDDASIYENRMARFSALKEAAVSCPLESATLTAFIDARDDLQKQLESTPVYHTCGILYLLDDRNETDDGERVEYSFDPKDMTEEERAQYEAMLECRVNTTKVGRNIVVSADDVRRVIRSGQRGIDDYKITALAYPKFRYDEVAATAYLNDKPYARTDEDGWVADAQHIATVMRGYDAIAVGDIETMKRQLFKVMSYMFTAPFMARVRRCATREEQSSVLFPNYCILYGDSNAGKTTFVKMCLRAMYGSSETGVMPSDSWTKSKIRYVDGMCDGMCIMLDDPPTTPAKTTAIIRNDDYLSRREKQEEHAWPIYVLTLNSASSFKPEIAKRAVLVRTEARIDREAGIRYQKVLNESIAQITTSFYLEYLRRMSPRVGEIEQMPDDVPDVLGLSSQILHAMFSEAGCAATWNEELSYGDFIGETETGRVALDKLREAWQVDPTQFRVRAKNMGVEYHPAVVEGDRWARKELKDICDELPTAVQASVVNDTLVIKNTAELEKLLGMTLDNGLLSRVRRLLHR